MAVRARLVDRRCVVCGKEFKARKADVNRNFAKFCSRSCCGVGRYKKPIERNKSCAWCKALFHKCESRASKSKSGLLFCSRVCKDSAQRLDGLSELHLPHYGNGNGRHTYRQLMQEILTAGRCTRCFYAKNPGILVVHHIDRDRNNNVKSNLCVLCPNCHAEDHFAAGDGMYSNKFKNAGSVSGGEPETRTPTA